MKTNKPHPVQQEKDNIQTKPTDSDTEVKAIDGEDFGPVSENQKSQEQADVFVGAVNESTTETRKNVNADPNIIQSNKLNEENNK